jgi:hypothetical protein
VERAQISTGTKYEPHTVALGGAILAAFSRNIASSSTILLTRFTVFIGNHKPQQDDTQSQDKVLLFST